MLRRVLIALVILSVAGGPLLAQSLGEVAAKEKERRQKEKKAPAKVYTNDDLSKKDEKKGSEGEASATTASGAVSNAEAVEADPEADARARAEDESKWRRLAREHRERIRKAEEKVPEIQARLDALMADTSPTDLLDPNRLQTIEARKAAAREELEAAKAELAQARKALEDLEEQARRAGVPPGWLREP